MEQLILHLFGDFVTQSDWMAVNKSKRTWPALCHVTLYSTPFFLIGSLPAVTVIFASHFIIDRFRLIRYLVWAKNWIGPEPYSPWRECADTGFAKTCPPWLATWLMIVADATVHLACNYCALRWL
jgi:Protein of unknown function (DUF3307)